jgi:hypothetical protein
VRACVLGHVRAYFDADSSSLLHDCDMSLSLPSSAQQGTSADAGKTDAL